MLGFLQFWLSGMLEIHLKNSGHGKSKLCTIYGALILMYALIPVWIKLPYSVYFMASLCFTQYLPLSGGNSKEL